MQTVSNQPIYLLRVSSTMPNFDEHEPCRKLIQEINVKATRLQHFSEVYKLISDPLVKMDIIILDLEDLYKDNRVTMWAFIHSISTMIKSMKYLNSEHMLVPRKAKISVCVKKNTDINLIKDAISNVDIAGICARSDEFSHEECKESILDILAGKSHVPKYIQERLHPKKKSVSKVVVSKDQIKLTTRQNQILDMVANRGASNKMIAKTLNISESTVKLHVGTILKKFGARNRTQLAIFGKNYNTQVQV